jgi:hypothetical protein
LGKFISNHRILSEVNFPFADISSYEYYLFTCGDLYYEVQDKRLNEWMENWIEAIEKYEDSKNKDDLYKALKIGVYLGLIIETHSQIFDDTEFCLHITEFDPNMDQLEKLVTEKYKQRVKGHIQHVMSVSKTTPFLIDWAFEDYYDKVSRTKALVEKANEFCNRNRTPEIKLITLNIIKSDPDLYQAPDAKSKDNQYN